MGNQILFLLLCSLSFVMALAQNYTANFDSYWQMKAEAAMIRTSQAYHPDPFNVTNFINYRARMALGMEATNATRRMLAKKYRGPCKITNPIDACWRCRPNWAQNRKRLAKCALGFARGTTGGMAGRIYVVSDPSDNDMVNPKPGTLRHAVIQTEPLWIIFAHDMNIKLQQELLVESHKTIDGRGKKVVIAKGAGITIQFVENVIIHGLQFKDIVPKSGGLIRDSVDHFGFRTRSDGDAISIFGSHHVWIDHVTLSKAFDGLIDVILGSTAITISNCKMNNHNAVFLFGASPTHKIDRKMQITVAYNRFGKELVQRMPRCRFGFFHLVNNDYTHWKMYAIGGSQNPTIISQGNRFIAPPNERAKMVTHRELPLTKWNSGTWRSEKDLLLNGAKFKQSGNPLQYNPYREQVFKALPGKHAGRMTRFVGPLKCVPNKPC